MLDCPKQVWAGIRRQIKYQSKITQKNINNPKNSNMDTSMEEAGTSSSSSSQKTVKGRGHSETMDVDVNDRYSGNAGVFETLDSESEQAGPQRCM
jgi:hypothetical protein